MCSRCCAVWSSAVRNRSEIYSLLHALPQPYVGQLSLTAGRHNAKRESKSCRMVHVGTVYRGRGLPWFTTVASLPAVGITRPGFTVASITKLQQQRHEHQRKLERKFSLNIQPSWVVVMPVVAAGCMLDSIYADDTCTHHSPCSNQPLV